MEKLSLPEFIRDVITPAIMKNSVKNIRIYDNESKFTPIPLLQSAHALLLFEGKYVL